MKIKYHPLKLDVRLLYVRFYTQTRLKVKLKSKIYFKPRASVGTKLTVKIYAQENSTFPLIQNFQNKISKLLYL